MRGIIGVGLGFYFRRIERFHPERVPASGSMLFTSNHPNSLTDSFVIGAAVPRKVNFVATVQLFQFKPLKWLLSNCGMIPINRVKDDPRSMRTVADTFEAVYRVLERGEAVGIFPEGITHDDPQLKTVKTGAARMALELEHRHGGKLGLQIVPVGLSLSAKNKYRSEVLVNFGPAIRAADFLAGYAERKKECINALNAEIEKNIQLLILHIPQMKHARVVEAVKRLYLDKLRVANRTVPEPAGAECGRVDADADDCGGGGAGISRAAGAGGCVRTEAAPIRKLAGTVEVIRRDAGWTGEQAGDGGAGFRAGGAGDFGRAGGGVRMDTPAAAVSGGEMGGGQVRGPGAAQGANFDGGDHRGIGELWIFLRRVYVGLPLVLWLASGDLVRAVTAGGGDDRALLRAEPPGAGGRTT